MRIVNWNCNGAFRKKIHLMNSIDADIYIIQECEDPQQSRDIAYKQWARNHLWTGENKNKGLAVFAKESISIQRLCIDSGALKLFLPFIADGLYFLAVWTKEANSPTFKYIGQLYKWLQLHKGTIPRENSIVIGDLNSNACWDVWDRWWNHSDVVRELSEIGLNSIYHTQHKVDHGKEPDPTFFLHRNIVKPYHIDYAFLSENLLEKAALKIGEVSQWLEHSDHLPLIIDIPQ